MAKYILAFHRGDAQKPETPEAGKAQMEDWGRWVNDLGSIVINPGTPLGQSYTVSKAGVVDNGGSNPLDGYMTIDVETLEKALEVAGNCPSIAFGGTIEVANAVQMPKG